MFAPTELISTNFNTLALQTQDEAYTLAYYLLGDETRAEEATQLAFASLYQRARLGPDAFRLEALRRVLAKGRAKTGSRFARQPIPRTGAHDALTGQLLALPIEHRSAVILVDMLGLNYDEASQVLGCSKKQFTHLLAQARRDINCAAA